MVEVEARKSSRSAQEQAELEQALERANEILRAGSEAQRSAARLSLQLDTAADQLVVAVDRIAAEVDRAVLNNQPDIGAISGIVGGLGNLYTQISPTPLAPRPIEPPEAGTMFDATTGEDLIAKLRNAADPVATSTNDIAVFVNAIAEAASADKLRGCGVDPTLFAVALALDPPGPITFTAGTPETKTAVVSGGRSPYGGQIPQAPEGLILQQPEVFGPIFTLQSTAALTTAGSYVLIVRDGAGRRKTAAVEVAPKKKDGQDS